jgi:hypothetical protein
VLTLARGPAHAKAASQLEGAIEDLLAADPGLLASVVALLEAAPPATMRLGDRSSYVGGSSFGPVITGDGNTVSYRRRP